MAKNTPEKKEEPKVETVTYATSEINKVLDYIGNQPFKDVSHLVRILQTGKVSAA